MASGKSETLADGLAQANTVDQTAGGVDETLPQPVSGLEATVASSKPVSGLEATVASSKPVSGLEATVAPRGAAAPVALVEVTRAYYDIADELARGGMGRILIARDRRIGRTVALKELLGSGDALHKRFEREALVTGRLQHPAIVPVYEAGRWPSGEPFFAMKLVKGRPFDKVLADKHALDERLALLPTVIQICEAIAYAHGERVIHRDLKPANVLVGSFGETVVIDWGLAKDLADDADDSLPAGPYRAGGGSGDLTVVGSVMGTPMYMPPEQAAGKNLDERADVYSLGAILYHVLAGAAPYTGKTSGEILDKVIAVPPAPISTVAGVPDELATIVGKAMARAPEDRYPTAKELAEELVRFQAGQLVGSHRYSRWDLVKRFARRHRAALGALAALLVIGGVLAVISFRQIMRARDDARLALSDVEAERRATLVEQGRQELVAGEAMRAATYFAGSYSEPDELLRIMLAQAMQPVDALRGRIDSVSVEWLIPVGVDRFVTVDIAGTVALWDLDGTSRGILGEGNSTGELAVTVDGSRVALSREGKIALVETATLREIAAIDDVDGPIALATDGSYLYGVTAEGVGRWDRQGKPDGVLPLPDKPQITSLDPLVDGRVIVGTAAGAFEIPKSFADPKLVVPGASVVVRVDRGRRHVVFAKTTAKDGKPTVEDGAESETHLIGGDGTTRFPIADDNFEIDATGARRLEPPKPGAARDAVLRDGAGKETAHFSAELATLAPDASRVAMADASHVVRLVDDRGMQLAAWPGHRSAVTALAFTTDGKLVLSAGKDGVRIWRVPQTTERRIAATAIADAASSPDRRQFVVAHNGDAVIHDVATGTVIATLAGKDRLWSAVFSPDGTRVITTSSAGKLAVWDVATRHAIASVELYAWSVRFSPDGARVITAGEVEGHIRNAATGASVVRLAGADLVMSARFSADGTRAITAGRDGIARVYDAATGSLTLALRGHTAYLVDASFDPTGTRIVTTSGDATARLFDASTGVLLAKLDSHAGPLRAATFSPAGDRLLTVAADGARVWNGRSGALLQVLANAENDTRGGRFIAEGAAIATYTTDHVKIWETSRGAPLFRLPAATLPTKVPVVRLQAATLQGAIEDPRQRPAELVEIGDRLLLVRRQGGLVLELSRERRPPFELAAILDKRNGWKLADGGLIPSRDAPDRTERRFDKITTYDFSSDTISAEPLRPDYAPTGPFDPRFHEAKLALDAATTANRLDGDRALASARAGRDRVRLELAAHAAIAGLPDAPALSADALYELAWLRYKLGLRAGAYRALFAASATIPQSARKTVRRELFGFATHAGISFDDTLAAVAGSPVADGLDRHKLVEELATVYAAASEDELEQRALRELAPRAAPTLLATIRSKQASHAFDVGDTREFGDRAVEALELALRPGFDRDLRLEVLDTLTKRTLRANRYFSTTKNEGYARAAIRIANLLLAGSPTDEDAKALRTVVDGLAHEIAEGPRGGGRYDKEIIRAAIRRRVPHVRRCYEDGLVRDRTLTGTFVFDFTIVGGVVTAVHPLRARDPEVARCIARNLKQITLPRITGADIIRVNYPFELRTEN